MTKGSPEKTSCSSISQRTCVANVILSLVSSLKPSIALLFWQLQRNGYVKMRVFYKTCRGSLGFGEDSVQSLLGNIGRNDISDCIAALDVAVSQGILMVFASSTQAF